MATEMLQSYYDWAEATELKLFEWVDPNGAYKVHPQADYPLANFASVYAICVGYLLFVIFGTALMKAGVPALNTSALQFVYNPLQVIVCSYMCLEAAIQAYRNGYTAAPCNDFNAAKPVMANVLYLFFISKILDLCDTFFIIMGKKWKQLSVLHVYHHLTVLFFYYIAYRCAQDGDIYVSIVLNGFVHTIMYTYYFVSSHTREIWWKKYLTSMQLIQFVLMNVQGYMTYSRECAGMPRKVPILYLGYVQSLFWLFMNFYIRAYVLGGGNKKPVAAAGKKNKSV
jgi:elongation of very long chain fatty acids protein 4